MSIVKPPEKSSEPFLSELHRAAIEYARDGYPVFPCIPNGKVPATGKGFHDATTDIDTINRWWRECPTFNIGIEPERLGLCVVEIEPDGLAQVAEFCDGHGPLPRTFTNRSPRGGEHRFFAGSLQSLVRPFKGFEIDTRGRGGYVLLPPSHTADGEYTTIDDGDVADLPEWITARLASRKYDRQASAEGLQDDLPDNVRRAERWLSDHKPPVSGERNYRTFIAACRIKDLGCSPDKTLELITAWAPIAEDFTEDEVQVIVSSAFKNGQNMPGNDAVQPSSEAFKNLLASAPKVAPSSVRSKSSPFRPTPESEMDREAQIEWLIPEFLQRKSTAMIAAKTQSYKSFIALDIALAVASGVPTFGAKPTRTGPVVYASLEGLRGIKTIRRRAWRQARGIEPERELPFFTTKAPLIRSADERHEFISEMQKAFPGGVELVVLETVAKMMLGMDENSSKDASIFCAFCDELVEHLGCAVVAVHHQSDKANAADYRGSSAFMAGVDHFFEVKADRASTTVRVWQTKVKDGEPREAPWHFRGVQSGPSMALELVSEAQHREAVKGRDPCSPRAVGQALASLGARGIERAVGTNVLASELAPPEDGEVPTDQAKRIAAIEKQLRRRQQDGLLDGYCDRDDRGQYLWYLP